MARATTHAQIHAAISEANTAGTPMLAAGRNIYLLAGEEDQLAIEHFLTKLANSGIRNLGPVVSLEILTAVIREMLAERQTA